MPITKKRTWDLVYEVSFVDETRSLHIGDMLLCDMNPSDNHDAFIKRATDYWKGQNPKFSEVVTDSPVRIVRRI